MNSKEITSQLLKMQDKEYSAFQARIIPSVEKEKILGIRTPQLRTLAKSLAKEEDTETFLQSLPHKYFEENQLHAFLLSLEKDFNKCISQIENFLPHIDNWATCDQLSPKSFKKEKE